ncbi:hypothetical protein A3850_012140 [Lewinella sp. 4G2]|nr:hypothetical protein A3850_012140 [Lewinella sp. 4G2]
MAQDTFLPVVSKAAKLLWDKASGLRWWSHWVGEDGQMRADVVCWDGLDSAFAAAEMVMADPDFQFFSAAIAAVQHMGHYRSSVNAADLRGTMETKSGLLELALFSTKDPATSHAIHPKLHSLLSQREGCHHHAMLRHDKDADVLGDLAIWQSKEQHELAAAALMGLPELGPYFSSISEMKVFGLFAAAGTDGGPIIKLN